MLSANFGCPNTLEKYDSSNGDFCLQKGRKHCWKRRKC